MPGKKLQTFKFLFMNVCIFISLTGWIQHLSINGSNVKVKLGLPTTRTCLCRFTLFERRFLFGAVGTFFIFLIFLNNLGRTGYLEVSSAIWIFLSWLSVQVNSFSSSINPISVGFSRIHSKQLVRLAMYSFIDFLSFSTSSG